MYGLLELDSATLAATAELDTTRLTDIAPDALHALTQRTDKKHSLVLSALKTISPEQAAALTGYHGDLDLDGVTSLTPAVARALAAGRPQAAEDPSVGRFSLRGLQPWDPEVIRPRLATRRFRRVSGHRDGDEHRQAGPGRHRWASEIHTAALSTLVSEVIAEDDRGECPDLDPERI